MTFQDEMDAEINVDENSKQNWTKISNFILKKDKNALRTHLLMIDNKLYSRVKKLTHGVDDNFIDLNDLNEINSAGPLSPHFHRKSIFVTFVNYQLRLGFFQK